MISQRSWWQSELIWGFSLVDLVALSMSLFQIYYTITVAIDPHIARIVHFEFGLLIFLLMVDKKPTGNLKRIFIFALVILSLITILYPILNYNFIVRERFPYVTPVTLVQMILGIILITILLYALLGSAGIGFFVVTGSIILYGLYGTYLPGILRHGGMSIQNLVDAQYLTSFGIFGSPIGVSLTYVFGFMVFGEFLIASGMGQFIMDIAIYLGGAARGGPTKIAVVSSAAFGMISGSAVSNVVTTGSFTIPLAKSIGYSPAFAAAVEAVASSGGAIMPPVMGIVAFLMADFTGIPYSTIIIYAVIPALLYYWAAFLAVHFRACRTGLLGVPKEKIPDLKTVLRKRGHLVIPVILLVYLLIESISPGLAAWGATGAVIIVSCFRKETRMSVKTILFALVGGAKMAAPLVVMLGGVGMIIVVIAHTGLGVRLGQMIIDLSQQHLLFMFLAVAITTTILGMGLPTSASYLIQVAVSIPPMLTALEASGLAPRTALVAAHFFIMYYASLAPITPPVALASYAAAGLAGSSPMKTGFLAWRIAIPIFIMPFLFVYVPELLLVGSPNYFVIVYKILLIAVGMLLLEACFEGYLIGGLGILEKIICFVGGIATFAPIVAANVFGILIGVAIFFVSLWKRYKVQKVINSKMAG